MGWVSDRRDKVKTGECVNAWEQIEKKRRTLTFDKEIIHKLSP